MAVAVWQAATAADHRNPAEAHLHRTRRTLRCSSHCGHIERAHRRYMPRAQSTARAHKCRCVAGCCCIRPSSQGRAAPVVAPAASAARRVRAVVWRAARAGEWPYGSRGHCGHSAESSPRVSVSPRPAIRHCKCRSTSRNTATACPRTYMDGHTARRAVAVAARAAQGLPAGSGMRDWSPLRERRLPRGADWVCVPAVRTCPGGRR